MVIGNLEWQDGTVENVTLAQAQEYAASLGNGWRVPTIDELLSLVDTSKYDPACSVFPDAPATYTWSSTLFAGSAQYARTVDFMDGNADNAIYVENPNVVRAVRIV